MTKKAERNELHRLYDMQEAIAKIQTQPEYAQGRESFDNDERYQVWVIHHIERIGECSSVLRKDYDYDKKHPELELDKAQGMRRRLVHKYWETDLELIWKAVLYLPDLKEKLDKIVKEKELLREANKAKESEPEKSDELVLPYPEPKSRLQELANKRAIMRAEGKLEKQLNIADKSEKKPEPEKDPPKEIERDL